MKRLALTAITACLAAAAARADQQAIIGWIERFFATRDSSDREKLAELIANDPDFDRSLMSDWLHKAKLFAPQESGTDTLDVTLPDQSIRKLTVRVPGSYRPNRPWPMIYALHARGANGAAAIAQVQKSLGSLAEAFIVAAPENYGDALIGDSWPPTEEHLACISALRSTFHLNSDRVYVFGVEAPGDSPGNAGDAGFTIAATYPDLFAGAIVGGGALRLPGGDALYPRLIHNLQSIPLLIAVPESDAAAASGAGRMNELLYKAAVKAGPKPPWEMLTGSAATAAIASNQWPAEELQSRLARTREHAPRRIRQVFRHVLQARAYWLEGREWVGTRWDDKPIAPATNATDPAARDASIVKSIDSRLGELSGDIKDQNITIGHKGVTEVTVWLTEGMVQFTQPVRILSGGETAFFGPVQPDVLFCLTQAERTRDFDLLRWSAITIKGRGKGRILTAADLK